MSSTSVINSLLSSSSANVNSAIDLSNILASASGSSTPGIDVTAAVNAALYADRATERVWQSDQATLTSQMSAVNSIETATQALQNDMESLNSLAGPFAARTVSSSNSNVVTGSAAAGTTSGVHTVVVNSLATYGSWYSDLASSATATLPTSSMTITSASGATATFALGNGNAGDNLNDLATAINANTSLGVTASVMTDSTGSRLAIVSNSLGTANDFTITSPNYTGTSWTSSEMPTGSTLGANTITLSNAAGANLSITSTSGETYAQFATQINNAVSSYNATATANGTATLNVNATAGSTSSGTNLNIASTDGSAFTINQPAFGFTQANAATDATLTVDGVPVDSASNTVTGAIPGVTLSLLGTSVGTPVTLTVAPDATQISSSISQFVTDYNSAINLVNQQFAVTSGTDSSGNPTTSQGALGSDPTFANLQATLEQALNYVYTPSSGSTTVSSLQDLGITVGNDGTLSVNSGTLDTALATNPTDVQNFFEGSALNGFANNLYTALNGFTSPGNGAFQVDLQSMQSQYSDYTSQINDFETNYIAGQQTILTAEFSTAEQALQALPEQMQQLNAELGFNNNPQGG